jgi:hypothetical protein
MLVFHEKYSTVNEELTISSGSTALTTRTLLNFLLYTTPSN